jgi:hypothetical protein
MGSVWNGEKWQSTDCSEQRKRTEHEQRYCEIMFDHRSEHSTCQIGTEKS